MTSNSVSIEQGVRNFIRSAGSTKQALADAQARLQAYQPGGFMQNASDAEEAREWYAGVVSRLEKMAKARTRRTR